MHRGLLILSFFFILAFVSKLIFDSNILIKHPISVSSYKNLAEPIALHTNFEINITSNVNKIYLHKFYIKSNVSNSKDYSKIDSDNEFKIKNSITRNNKKNFVQLVSSDWKNNLSKKKIKFIETLLPLILYQNNKILLERQRLTDMRNHLSIYKTLDEEGVMYIRNIAKKYDISYKNIHKIDLIDKLLLSVDIIPNSIVLAQAANESGWGTSRFAKEYNALFGQYTYNKEKGIIPFERESGQKHLIRYFSSIDQSVESYFKNINTHYAYEDFRKLRSQIKKEDIKLSIKLLTSQLDVYAEDKFYVKTINSIIDSNNFLQFDEYDQLFFNS